MLASRIGACLIVAGLLTGCGTYVPEIQEFGQTKADAQDLVREITHSVRCEITNAIIDIAGRKYPDGRRDPGKQRAAFLDGWGAEVALTLTIDEKTTVSPNGAWIPNALFSLGSGLSLSSGATRMEKMNFFYELDKLRNTKQPCGKGSAFGSYLVQSDLRVKDWLLNEVTAVDLSEIAAPTDPKNVFEQNVMQHQVTFDIITSADLTPSFKLVRASVNPSTFFSTNRERKHDLLITLGPMVAGQPNGQLIPIAENLHSIAQFNLNANSAVTR